MIIINIIRHVKNYIPHHRHLALFTKGPGAHRWAGAASRWKLATLMACVGEREGEACSTDYLIKEDYSPNRLAYKSSDAISLALIWNVRWGPREDLRKPSGTLSPVLATSVTTSNPYCSQRRPGGPAIPGGPNISKVG